MNIKTSLTNPSENDSTQNDHAEEIVSQDQDGSELYDSHTPDSYDPHIIPSETAARKEREGDNFKRLAKHPVGSNSIDTTGGFTVDKEGLVDNFAIEPEMYYTTRGDLPNKVKQEAIRQEVIRQEEIRQGEIHQGEIRQEEIRQEAIRQGEIRKELKKLGVGTFLSYETTEIALIELKNSGFLMDRVSVAGRDINSHTEVTGVHTSNRLADAGNLDTNENKVGEIATDGAMAGVAVGGVTGLLVGLGLIAIPAVGPVMLAGTVATAIATAISGSFIGAAAGSLIGGLVGLGIPAHRAKVYSDRVAQGDYLVMVEGSDADITLADSIFTKHDVHEWYVYDLPRTVRHELTDH